MPLPLVILLMVLAIASIVTSARNPLNSLSPFYGGSSAVLSAQKAISLQRIQTIGQAIDRYYSTQGSLPDELQELVPAYVSPVFLTDPWGNAYKYLPRPERYLVVGFTPDGKADTDLFLSRAIDLSVASSVTPQNTGGIQLID